MKNSKYRLGYMIGIGLFISILFKVLLFKRDLVFDDEILFITFTTVVLWEGNFRIDDWLNKKHPWIADPSSRLGLQLILNLMYSSIILTLTVLIINYLKFNQIEVFNPKLKEVFFPALLIIFILLISHTSRQFLKSWKASLIEVEKYKTESANAQLHNLKNQLNPHFLFNNLSVLTSLVHKNQDKATDFISELAKVYRYVLDNNNSELVTLKEELDFINHYIYLQKIRFEDSLVFTIKIEEIKLSRFLLPMCLQTLVENSIQHNEASQANPLHITIYTEENYLIIENPILARSEIVQSTQMGLKNIELRYSFILKEKINVLNDGKTFKVILPLI